MSGSQPIRVLVIQHDPVVQAGLSVALGRCEDLTLVDPEVWRTSSESADVVVADYRGGMELMSGAVARNKDDAAYKVLIVTTNEHEPDVRRALKLGVQGYLVAGGSLDALLASVREVHLGRLCLDPDVAQRLAQSLYIERLTPREEAVLGHVAAGRCNKEIATQLDIAVGTVKSHLRTIYAKLEVGSRTQAAAAASSRGLLRPEVSGRPRADWPGTDALTHTPGSPHVGASELRSVHRAPLPVLHQSVGATPPRHGHWSPALSRTWAARQSDFGEAE